MPADDHLMKTYKQGKFIVEEFPVGFQMLNKELATQNHPKLMALLDGQPMDDIDVKLAIISHYCGVVLDGVYTLEARSELCAILAGRLEVMREFISVMPTIIQ